MQTTLDSLRYRKDIVLVGGGHAHALVALQWAMHPLEAARITLISEQSTSPYSGMLPGVVAGHYTSEDIHIDLRRLCQHAGIRFIRARVTGVDPDDKRVLLQGRPPVDYDLLSINVGITPDVSVRGADEFAVPVKPIATFLPRWQTVFEQLQQASTPRTVAVVGGGAGSVELVLSMAHRLQSAGAAHEWLLITRSEHLLPEYPARLHRQLQKRLQYYRIRVIDDAEVAEVNAAGLVITKNQHIAADHVFWCTQARPATWMAQSGLAVNAQGFLAVNDALQSESHPDVFAAGDCAYITNYALPRAGVYAVREAPVLRENLQRKLLGLTLKTYTPQRNFLSLLACGGRDAVGAKGTWSIAGPWVWRWKDRIDRRFMQMFHGLPVRPPLPVSANETLATAQERCGGCGGKVGGDILRQALIELDAQGNSDPNYCPLASAEDAAVISIPANAPQQAAVLSLVQSVDALKPLFDDPWLFARMATVHALSDLFAMNAVPHSAQLLLQLPVLRPRLQQRDLQQILQGVRVELAGHGAVLAGGHTLEAESLQIGLTVNAFAVPATILRKRGAKPGDQLILTKPLGTGVLFAAAMRGYSKAEWMDNAIASMLISNAKAAEILAAAGAHALTDITGFGLVGHLQEMLAGSGVGARLRLSALPMLPGVTDCLQKGYESTLAPANRRMVEDLVNQGDVVQDVRYGMLFDPQTSGGLLAAVSVEQFESCLRRLQKNGIDARVIGECMMDDRVGVAISV